MDISYQHSRNQQILKQRNLLALSVAALACLTLVLLLVLGTRDREIILQPVLRTPMRIC